MGYAKEIFIKPPNDDWVCSICKDFLENPLMCPLGHNFCKECIYTWNIINTTCPLDSKTVKLDEFKLNLSIRNYINNNPARCINCAWTGIIDEYNDHIAICEFEEMECPFYKCKDKILRRDMVEHEKNNAIQHIRDLNIFSKNNFNKLNKCLNILINVQNRLIDEVSDNNDTIIDVSNELKRFKNQQTCNYNTHYCSIEDWDEAKPKIYNESVPIDSFKLHDHLWKLRLVNRSYIDGERYNVRIIHDNFSRKCCNVDNLNINGAIILNNDDTTFLNIMININCDKNGTDVNIPNTESFVNFDNTLILGLSINKIE